MSWGVLGNDVLPAGSSRVEFRLSAIATGTRLDLTHSELPDTELEDHRQGWTHFVGRLAEVHAPT